MSDNWNEMRKRAYWKEQLASESPSPAPAVAKFETESKLVELSDKPGEKLATLVAASAVGELVKELRWLKVNLNHVILSGEKERLRLAIEDGIARIEQLEAGLREISECTTGAGIPEVEYIWKIARALTGKE